MQHVGFALQLIQLTRWVLLVTKPTGREELRYIVLTIEWHHKLLRRGSIWGGSIVVFRLILIPMDDSSLVFKSL